MTYSKKDWLDYIQHTLLSNTENFFVENGDLVEAWEDTFRTTQYLVIIESPESNGNINSIKPHV